MKPAWLGSPGVRMVAGVLGSALLLGLYARGGAAFALGFVALLPWLLALDTARSMTGALIGGVLMSAAFVFAVLGWFAPAVDGYTGIGSLPALGLLVLLAPLLQPQFLAFAVVRHAAGHRHGARVKLLAGACAWIACEWLLPKLFGDSLGHGLLPSALLRQGADLAGVAGLTFLLILVNEALAGAAGGMRDGGLRRARAPAVLAVALIASMLGYGAWRIDMVREASAIPSPSIRIGMVQTGIVDYERLRREMGAYAVVRHVLDTHFALSRAAIEHHGAEALLWSETVYPTTFGHPRSEDGAALDQEIRDFVDAAGVPLVFGTYDLDAGGEYNAAAFLEPGRGLLGYYRKTHPFPLTEHVPRWLDGPTLRRWLPWTGGWQPGNGARVLPLRMADGRTVDVLPLICLDDVRPGLAIDGARLGAQAILGLSNDSWFSADPQGARLHLAVAAFRSIETRLPQIRVTSNGLSAIIDETGEVLAVTGMADQAVLAADIPARPPLPTLVVRWGDWLGGVATLFLIALALRAGAPRLWPRRTGVALAPPAALDPRCFDAPIALLTPGWRAAAAALWVTAGAALAWLGIAMLLRDGLQVTTLAPLRQFAATVLAPALAAWAITRAFAGRARIEGACLVLDSPALRIDLPLDAIAALRTWRVALPGAGVDVVLTEGARLPRGLAIADPQSLVDALRAAGSPARFDGPTSIGLAEWARLRSADAKRWFDHALVKFVLFPLLPALPAFRLHQVIAYGGAFGEYYTYGLGAYLAGLAIWWGSWALGLVLLAALLRVLVEVATLLAWRVRRSIASGLRRGLEASARILYFAGVPIWLLLRFVGG